MTSIVESIPDRWGWVDGRLDGPHYRSPLSQTTGYRLSRADGLRIVAEGACDADRIDEIPDLLPMLTGGKEPKFFEFSLAGMGSCGPPLVFVKRMIVHLLAKVYRGSLSFYSGGYDGNLDNNPAIVHCTFLAWQGYTPTKHSTLELTWCEQYGGRADDLAPIIAVCRAFNLAHESLAPNAYEDEAQQ